VQRVTVKTTSMKVLIVKPPIGTSRPLGHLKVGMVYDLPPALASYLVTERFAIFERRSETNPKHPPPVDRRRKR
jgi:hypothetical protein